MIWQHGDDKLEQLHEYAKGKQPNIKLTLTSSATIISYLDVTVPFDGTNIQSIRYSVCWYRESVQSVSCLSVDIINTLDSSVYLSFTDRHGSLHYNSFTKYT